MQHIRQQHKERFDEYTRLTYDEKQTYFGEGEAKESINMKAFVQLSCSAHSRGLSKQSIQFVIDEQIVSKLISDLLFDQDDESQEKNEEPYNVLFTMKPIKYFLRK